MANQITWTAETPHPLITPITTDLPPEQDNLHLCGLTPDFKLVRPGSRLQLRYNKVVHIFEPLEPIQQQTWQQHGDHPFVQHYGPSLLDQYPNYASCGVVRLDFMTVAHVAPGSTLYLQNGYIFKVEPPAATNATNN